MVLTAMIGSPSGSNLSVLREKIPSSYEYSGNRFLDFVESNQYDLLKGFFEWEKEIKKGWVDRSGVRRQYSNAAYNHLLSAGINRMKFALDGIESNMTGAQRFEIVSAMKKLKRKKRDPAVPDRRICSYEEVQELIAKTSAEEEDPMWALLIQFTFRSTARVSEIAGILLSDIHPENHKFYRIRLRTKGGKERDTSVPRDLVDQIRAACESKTWLFEHSGKPFTRSHLSMKVKRLARRHLKRELSIHSLRHAWASWAHLKAGVPLKEVQLKLGHSSIKTTGDLYIHGDVGADFEDRLPY